MTIFSLTWTIILGAIVYFLVRWFSKLAKRNVEDLYQEQRADAHEGKAIISVVATFPDDAAFDCCASTIEEKLKGLATKYMQTHAPCEFNFIVSVFPNIPAISEKWDVSVVLRAPVRSVCLELNHATVGGGCLVELGQYLANAKGRPDLPQSSVFMGVICLPSLLRLKWRPHVPTLPIDQSFISRFWWEFDYSKEPGKSLRSALLYKVLDTLRQATGKDTLRTYLPIAFLDNVRGARNNIGIMFLDFSASDTVSSLHRKIETYRAQVHATNLLIVNGMVAKNGGSKTRKSVDCVVTQVYLDRAENKDFLWSYYKEPEYPIYVAIASNKRADGVMHTNVTVTSVTSGFKPTPEMNVLEPPKHQGRLFFT